MNLAPDQNRKATSLFVWLFEKALKGAKEDPADDSIAFDDLTASLGKNMYLREVSEEEGVKIGDQFWLLDPNALTITQEKGELVIEADQFRDLFDAYLNVMPFLRDMPELNRTSLIGEFDLIDPVTGDKYYSPRDSFFILDPYLEEEQDLALISFQAFSEDSTNSREDVELYSLKIALFDTLEDKLDHLTKMKESYAKSAMRKAGKTLKNINALSPSNNVDPIISLSGLSEMESSSEGVLSQLLDAFISADNTLSPEKGDDFKSLSWNAHSLEDITVSIILASGDSVVLSRQSGPLTYVDEGIHDNISNSFFHQLNLFLIKEVGINQNMIGTVDFDAPKEPLPHPNP